MSEVSSPLLEFLRSKDGLYFGKALELREAVKGWLAYVPQTFPHYTRHTIEHSDEIVVQMSKLLFQDGTRPVVALSPVEAYILIAAAYLHDAGMVASDTEKIRLMNSDEWKVWTGGGGSGARRLGEIQHLRDGMEPMDVETRHFIADVQLRFLIAEFVRRSHHLRAGEVVREHQMALGRFAFDDRVLGRTIGDVCVAHGMPSAALDDSERFPSRRDVRGQAVNVRFVATILRLGDLLDMSCDRACPVLLNAACPLPSDSLAHWTQYQRIIHRLTAPDRVEIIAECETQDEHRVLQDWCQWIVDETKSAREAVARGLRHQEWQPPFAELEGSGASIVVRPAKHAKYIPARWTFELDADAVFERLIHDVYETPGAFVRELIQNSLDATRCQMYLDLAASGQAEPEYPNQADPRVRSRYPIVVSTERRAVRSELSEETEERVVISVEDCGIGMDSEVVQRFFLQVGRSFYRTEEFRRKFAFSPSSRFGIGVLSTFAVAERVVVETFKPSAGQAAQALRLTLYGPRNYLLTEKCERRGPGTRIEVWLRDGVATGQITEWVRRWCRRAEFPIVVREERAEEVVVRSETAADFVYKERLPGRKATVSVRAFPVERSGVFGELAYKDADGESWGHGSWLQYVLTKEDPRFGGVRAPEDLQCLHGVQVAGGSITGGFGAWARVDFRAERFVPFLSRGGGVRRGPHSALRSREHEPAPEVVARWEEVLLDHLKTTPRAAGENGWSYKQSLVDVFPCASFWAVNTG
jgi:hypothetical protein